MKTRSYSIWSVLNARTPSISVLATTLSILTTGIVSAANASVAELLEVCTSHHNSASEYISEIEQLGWKEVDGYEGEKVIDRTIWVRVPHFESGQIDPKNSHGTMTKHQHVSRPTLGQLTWQHAPNTIAQTKAFVSEGSALYVFLIENHKYPNSDFLEDTIHCIAIFPDGTKSIEMNNIILKANRFNGKILSKGFSSLTSEETREIRMRPHIPYLQKSPSGLTQTINIGSPLATDVLPLQNGRLIQFIPDQNILQSTGLAHLNYTTGFQSSFTYRYNEVTP